MTARVQILTSGHQRKSLLSQMRTLETGIVMAWQATMGVVGWNAWNSLPGNYIFIHWHRKSATCNVELKLCPYTTD